MLPETLPVCVGSGVYFLVVVSLKGGSAIFCPMRKRSHSRARTTAAIYCGVAESVH